MSAIITNRFLDEAANPYPARVILTDDPMRVKMLAAHHLDHAEPVNDSRGMIGYTGVYSKVPIAVFSVGFGEASTLLYLDEIVRGDAKLIVYIGECVSQNPAYGLRDIVLAKSCGGKQGAADADETLLRTACSAAGRLDIPVKALPVHTDDTFWLPKKDTGLPDADIVDFATNAVYRYARQKELSALSILTVSENSALNARMEAAERQSRFHGASRLAFETLALYNRLT